MFYWKTNVNWTKWKSYEDILFHKSGEGIARIVLIDLRKETPFVQKQFEL